MKRTVLELAVRRFPDIDRKELYAAILCGELYVEGGRTRDPKELVSDEAAVELRRRRYVSRGGEKLAAALEAWEVPVAGSVWIDAGSSTGGFTDALIQAGARRVYAVDVGKNQLAYTLRRNPRVTVFEETSLFDLPELDPPADCACCDLSFRSLAGAAAHLLQLTGDRRLLALLKPQFELKYRDVDGGGGEFDGVVRDPELLGSVLLETLLQLRERDGAVALALMESPIRGSKGNREFLVDLRDVAAVRDTGAPTVETLVEGILGESSR